MPYLIKDLGFFETGEPATFGSSLFKDFVADHETAYVTRCKKAGLVFMGRSSSPEFGLNANTEPRLYGSCHNPWNLECSPGGSSGGAAAAVSAGILPVAHATDGGGSIRIPAAQCGLFGLKPSRGRVSMAPDAGEGWGGLSAGHVVSRSVRNSALMLDCTAGPEPGDPYAAPSPERPFLEAIARPPRKLRIALMLKDHRGAKLHPECLKAVQGAAKLCASLGHVVEEADRGAAPTNSVTRSVKVSTSPVLIRNMTSFGGGPGQRRRQDHVIAREERAHLAPGRVHGIDRLDVLDAAHLQPALVHRPRRSLHVIGVRRASQRLPAHVAG